MSQHTKTPQEKKRLSYAKDRRNTFRENSKASRKAIPLSKALANRAERHVQNHRLAAAVDGQDTDSLVAVENHARATAPRAWRKHADMPLGEFLKWKAARKAARGR